MPQSNAGLKQIALCDVGTLLTTPVNPLVAGIRSEANYKREPHKEINDYLNKKFRNRTNFKVEWESLQPTIQYLKALTGWINLNCDMQILPVKQGATQECLQFVGANKPGLDFEYMLTGDKRSIKVTAEIAMEYDRAEILIDAGNSTTPMTFPGITGAGFDFDKFRAPYLMSWESPKGTSLFDAGDLIERSFSIKTKGKKMDYNNTKVDRYEVLIKIAARDASIAKQIIMLQKQQSPSVYIKEKNKGVFFDAFDIESGALTLRDEFEDKDDDRMISLTFGADVPVSDVSFTIDATHGTDAGDANVGAKGGTMNIGI